uniref:Uncharacterized protein n=1 Tax=Aegilops tauschii subsp. strangulata TaxID=200361 RepID=A0A453C2I7_AEGTS
VQRDNFISCFISYEFRTSNIEAHKLTKHALTLGSGHYIWLDHPGDLSFVPITVTVQ